ncbi:MAG: hypothetical protein ABJ092_14750 [Gillisia sp.]
MKLNPTIIPFFYLRSLILLCFCLAILGCKDNDSSLETSEKNFQEDTLVVNLPDLKNQTLEDEDTIRKILYLIETNQGGYDKAKITDGTMTIFMKYNYFTRQPEVTIAHKE